MKAITLELSLPRLIFTKALGTLWKGAYFLPTSTVRLSEIGTGPLPHERFVRVRPILAGISRTDLRFAFVEGLPWIAPAALPGGGGKGYLGHELVARVVEIGSGVQNLRVGDRVALQRGDACSVVGRESECRYCKEGNYVLCEGGPVSGVRVHSVGGAHSEELIAHELRFFKVPDYIRDEQAFLIGTGAVGVRAALRHPPRAGERVLVVGMGTIGLMTLQALKIVQPNCSVVAMAKYPHQAAMAKAKGADELIMASDGHQGVARATAGRYCRSPLGVEYVVGGFDAVFDTIGTSQTVTDCLRWSRARGTVVLVGSELRPLRVDLTPVWWQEVALIGIDAHGREEWQGAKIDTFDLVVEWLREGKLNFDGCLSARFPLADYRKALAYAADKRNRVIKVALEPNRDDTTSNYGAAGA